MSEVVIRSACAADLPTLAAIEESAAWTFDAYGAPLADGSPPAPLNHWQVVLSWGLLWVAEHSDYGPVGFLAAEHAEGGLLIAQIDVAMKHQQRGIGRRLMLAAIDWARGKGLAAVTLTTFRHIPWNAPFYASMGFVELGDTEMPPYLATCLADEAARGFEGRCGMRLAL